MTSAHLPAPAIDELTDLTYSAYTSSDYFDNVFNDEWLYWSCQPAYELNEAEMLYRMNVNATEQYYVRRGFIPVRKGTAIITAESKADADGDFLTEHINRARATRVQQVSDKVNNAESGVGDIYNNNKFTASGTMTNFGVDFVDQIQKLLNPTDWVKEVVPVTNEEDIDYDSYPGNQPRNVNHRVRCVYNPNPPKSATCSTDDRGASSYQYTY